MNFNLLLSTNNNGVFIWKKANLNNIQHKINVTLMFTSSTSGFKQQDHSVSNRIYSINQSIISSLTYDKTHMLTLNTELQYKNTYRNTYHTYRKPCLNFRQVQAVAVAGQEQCLSDYRLQSARTHSHALFDTDLHYGRQTLNSISTNR